MKGLVVDSMETLAMNYLTMPPLSYCYRFAAIHDDGDNGYVGELNLFDVNGIAANDGPDGVGHDCVGDDCGQFVDDARPKRFSVSWGYVNDLRQEYVTASMDANYSFVPSADDAALDLGLA